MPLPLLIIGIAAVAGATGFGLGVHGGVKTKKAKDKLSEAQKRDSFNRTRLAHINGSTCKCMDALGNNEMRILSDFKEFSELFERIKNKPKFENIELNGVIIPTFEGEKLKSTAVGAALLVSGLGGAALGTASGFAASGATTAAVMAWGTASTGTAISSLSGVAATNATLAALGGGSLAAGGGGIAIGTTVLGAATLGVGLLVGGVVFSVTGSVLSNKADKAWEDMLKNEQAMKCISKYLLELEKVATKYNTLLLKVKDLYNHQLIKMRDAVNSHGNGHVEWNELTTDEKLIVENTVMIVSILYNMCAVQLVKKSSASELNTINMQDILQSESEAESILKKMSDNV